MDIDENNINSTLDTILKTIMYKNNYFYSITNPIHYKSKKNKSIEYIDNFYNKLINNDLKIIKKSNFNISSEELNICQNKIKLELSIINYIINIHIYESIIRSKIKIMISSIKKENNLKLKMKRFHHIKKFHKNIINKFKEL